MSPFSHLGPRETPASPQRHPHPRLQGPNQKGVQDVREGPDRPQVRTFADRRQRSYVRLQPAGGQALRASGSRVQPSRPHQPVQYGHTLAGLVQEAEEGVEEDVQAGVRLQSRDVLPQLQEEEGHVRVPLGALRKRLFGQRGQYYLNFTSDKSRYSIKKIKKKHNVLIYH